MEAQSPIIVSIISKKERKKETPRTLDFYWAFAPFHVDENKTNFTDSSIGDSRYRFTTGGIIFKNIF